MAPPDWQTTCATTAPGCVSEALQRIGHLYPQATLPDGRKATVIAWLWARTVESPNPAFRGCQVPLVSSFWLSTKPGKEAWVEPVVEGKSYRFEVRTGKPTDKAAVDAGTKLGRGAIFVVCSLARPLRRTTSEKKRKLDVWECG